MSISVNSQNPDGIVFVSANITNSGGSGFSNWKLDYGPGNPAVSFVTPTLKSGATTVNGEIFEWDTTQLKDNNYYTLRLRASDTLGNTATTTIILLKAYGSTPCQSKASD